MKLTFNNVSKEYKNIKAVDNINYTMEHGVYGLLGVNGAGKTTLMQMISTIISPTNGSIKIDGKDIFTLGEEYLENLGYLPQDYGYYPDLTIYDYLMYISSIKGIKEQQPKRQ